MKTIEGTKHFLFEQIEKFQQFSAIGMPVMLVLNLAVSLFSYLQWRNIHPYVGISSLTVVMMCLYWSIAHIVVKKGETFKSKARAAVKYNPYSVWALSPLQWMLMNHIWAPILEGTKETKEQQAQVNMVKNWLKLGYIPKEDFPENLKGFYITKGERRL